jgi:glycosyltransferase involved in cell wall biosynthesis
LEVKVKIAQVAPLHESVPPKSYGGTERIVSYLTEELVKMGHDVTLFASDDSQTQAALVAAVPQAIRLSDPPRDPIIAHLLQLAEVERMADRFDIIHFHTDYLHFPMFRGRAVPQVTTLHGRIDSEDAGRLFAEFDDVPVISISDSQRSFQPSANWIGTVYNGVPEETYDFRPASGNYFAFIGRFSPTKGPEQAIEIAQRLEMPLKMAAKIDPCDREYYDAQIKPQLESSLIEYVGEVDEQGKSELLGGACATLFPIDWPEPFGLVMIESMACGTPVIAYRRGSVAEVMSDGVTGFVVESVDEAVQAARRLNEIDRRACRDRFVKLFTSRRMAQCYLSAYEKAMSFVDRPSTLC